MTRGAALRGTPFPYRRNSLNLFRLVLAATVLVAHSFYTTGNGAGPHIRGENLGGWAVAGFFAISGFLITRSRLRSSAADYLLHRIVRIFPAFLVCLAVTAFVFGPVAVLVQYGTLDGYLTTQVTPLQFIWSNITLYMNEFSIGRSLSDLPYASVWNGSLWTLYYEFLCYVLVWFLGSFAWFRRNAFLATSIFILTTALYAIVPLVSYAGLDGSFLLFLKLTPFFLGGAVAYFFIEKHGLNDWLAFAAIILSVGMIALIPVWGGQASAPFLAYSVLWLSTKIAQPQWISLNDVSYGFYIYAWPVQQMLVLFGVGLAGGVTGLVIHNVASILVTLVLAWLSWVLIERRVMASVRRASSASRVVSRSA